VSEHQRAELGGIGAFPRATGTAATGGHTSPLRLCETMCPAMDALHRLVSS
jgi:hypothetical protein